MTFRPHGFSIQCAVFPQDFPKFSQNSPTCLSKYSNLKFYLGRPMYQNEIISFAFERALYDLSFDILNPYIQLIVCFGFSFGKLCKNMEKLLFFRGATAWIGEIPYGQLWRDRGL